MEERKIIAKALKRGGFKMTRAKGHQFWIHDDGRSFTLNSSRMSSGAVASAWAELKKMGVYRNGSEPVMTKKKPTAPGTRRRKKPLGKTISPQGIEEATGGAISRKLVSNAIFRKSILTLNGRRGTIPVDEALYEWVGDYLHRRQTGKGSSRPISGKDSEAIITFMGHIARVAGIEDSSATNPAPEPSPTAAPPDAAPGADHVDILLDIVVSIESKVGILSAKIADMGSAIAVCQSATDKGAQDIADLRDAVVDLRAAGPSAGSLWSGIQPLVSALDAAGLDEEAKGRILAAYMKDRGAGL